MLELEGIKSTKKKKKPNNNKKPSEENEAIKIEKKKIYFHIILLTKELKCFLYLKNSVLSFIYSQLSHYKLNIFFLYQEIKKDTDISLQRPNKKQYN